MALQTPAGVALGHIYALHRDGGAGIPPAGVGFADHFALSTTEQSLGQRPRRRPFGGQNHRWPAYKRTFFADGMRIAGIVNCPGLRALLGTYQMLYECRVCGETLDERHAECPSCGRAEIAEYEL